MAVIDIETKDFDNKTKEGLNLVDLWAPWCSVCKMVMPSVEAIGEESKDLDVLKVNIDEEPDVASNLGVMSIPTLILYKDGEKVDSINGFAPKEQINEMIEKHK